MSMVDRTSLTGDVLSRAGRYLSAAEGHKGAVHRSFIQERRRKMKLALL